LAKALLPEPATARLGGGLKSKATGKVGLMAETTDWVASSPSARNVPRPMAGMARPLA
jgi:hypothetical protein